MAPTATREKADAQVEGEQQSRRGDDWVCLITGDGENEHAEPLPFTVKEYGRNAKRMWAIHRSKAHGIKSPRHEAIRRRQRRQARGAKTTIRKTTRKGDGTRTSRRTTRRIASPRAQDWRVEAAVGMVMEFAPMTVSRVEIDPSGEFGLFDTRGRRVIGGRVNTALTSGAR